LARFEVFANPSVLERKHTPYVLDVQNNHLQPLDSRVVIPLRSTRSFPKPAHSLNPIVIVRGERLVLDTASLAPVPLAMLKRPLEKADASSADILDALDTLFGSY
jgi:toxin CcdB